MGGETLASEIHEQGSVLGRLISSERARAGEIVAEVAGSFEYILIAARGTSDNAARYAKYLFGVRNRIPVALAAPSLFSIYRQPPDLRQAWVIGISQSGQSPDIVAVLEGARREGRPTLAITNKPASPLAKVADRVLPLHAGEERAVAATKTYTASLTGLALLSSQMRGDERAIGELSEIPTAVRTVLDRMESLEDRCEPYAAIHQCMVIGRGFNYATAFEVALKLQELTRVIASPYSTADFLHGPIAAVRDGFPMLLVAPSGQLLTDMKELANRLAEKGAALMVISDDDEILQAADLPLAIPRQIPEWLSPIVAVVPGQLLSVALARLRGLDPDSPAGLSKVTKTL